MSTDMQDCVFCRILAGALPGSLVYQDEQVTAFLDIDPFNAGHTLVVPNHHASSLGELDDDTAGHLFNIARRVAAALRVSGVRCEGVKLLLSDGEAAGQEVPHVHLHVVPRYVGDGFSLLRSRQTLPKPSRTDLDELAAHLRNVILAGGEPKR